jgi:hypothetical protein
MGTLRQVGEAEAWARSQVPFLLRTALPQYPLISDFGEEHGFSLYEIKDGSLLEVEKVSLQQQLNQFQHEVSTCHPSQPSSLSFLP